MMMQSKGKKTTTINIDKINGIENENEIDGYEITDEMKERISNGISESLKTLKSSGVVGINELIKKVKFPMAGIQESIIKATSQIGRLGLSQTNITQSLIQNVSIGIGTWFTPEIHEAMRLFGERMREKQAIEVDRYNNFTNVGMSLAHGFDCSISTKKECSDFIEFIWFSVDREDERFQLSLPDFFESITVTEWRDWGADYYILQRDKTLNRSNGFKKQLSTPALKEIEQGTVKKEQKGGNNVTTITKQQNLDTYKTIVKDICQRYKGQTQAKYPKLSEVMRDAISKPNQKGERQLGRYASDLNLIEKGSDKTLLTYTGQVVRQYCIDNSLNFSWFK